jgi:hypothetical protein
MKKVPAARPARIGHNKIGRNKICRNEGAGILKLPEFFSSRWIAVTAVMAVRRELHDLTILIESESVIAPAIA